jgi:hypothetical protein
VSECKYHEFCGRDVEDNSAEGLCILHSTDPTKDADASAVALATHHERNGECFIYFVFPERADFRAATFSKVALFGAAKFLMEAEFSGATFTEGAFFDSATFTERADFDKAIFSGRTLFAGRQERTKAAGHIFADTEVNFRQVIINPPDAVTFLVADLTKCQFQDTDLRKMQFVGATCPQKGRRTVVYDEIIPVQSADRTVFYPDIQLTGIESAEGRMRPWSQLERLYRELKQNYEDRRNYECAGDFHYGEKEMRRQNPETALGLRFFLWPYWMFSGYGERYRRPLLWAGLLFVGSTIGYMWWGLRPKASGPSLAWTNGWDWLQGTYYSFRVMTFLKPDDRLPVGYAHVINTFQTLLAPIFLGLFALALRQRLKR